MANGLDSVLATPLPHIQRGQVLLGKYRIGEVLGAGGMGIVVGAHHIALDQRVAIKFLLPEVANNRNAAARFLREARAATRIKSEHVARVSDVGTLDDGTAFMVMEYLDGRDLENWIRDDGPLDIPLAVELVLQACEAIAEAHSLGIVHRDLKPANLFAIRRADGLVAIRVLDFGISKASATPGSTAELGLTRTSEIIGSPFYMSPEQLLASRDADRRSDIWSLGVVLYELLLGRLPFDGESVPVVCAKILHGAVPPLRAVRPEVPSGLEAAILRCLERNPSSRFDNLAELAAAIVGFGPPRARFSAERIERTVASARVLTRPPARSSRGAMGQTLPLPAGSTMVLEDPQGFDNAVPWPPPTQYPTRREPTGTRRGRLAKGHVVGLGIGLAALAAIGIWLAVRAPSTSEPPRDLAVPSSAVPARGEPVPALEPTRAEVDETREAPPPKVDEPTRTRKKSPREATTHRAGAKSILDLAAERE